VKFWERVESATDESGTTAARSHPIPIDIYGGVFFTEPAQTTPEGPELADRVGEHGEKGPIAV